MLSPDAASLTQSCIITTLTQMPTYHYILVEVKYCRDTDPAAQQRDTASQKHQQCVLRVTIQKNAPQAIYCRPSDIDARSVSSNLQLIHKSPKR
jgi:hypothetical protein